MICIYYKLDYECIASSCFNWYFCNLFFVYYFTNITFKYKQKIMLITFIYLAHNCITLIDSLIYWLIILIQDTAGQERYRTITTAYYRGAMGFILMYDITNEESFNSVQDWITQIKNYSWDNAQVILVGNKCDMEEERVISSERGKQLAEQLGVRFFETSAKENINVKVCMSCVSQKFGKLPRFDKWD